jgi:hypothetical protein
MTTPGKLVFFVVISGVGLGCVEAVEPTVAPQNMGFASPLNTNAPDAYQPVFSGADGGLQETDTSTAQAECSPGTRLGVCEFCGPAGTPVAPESDGQCPAVQCPQRPITFERRQEGDVVYCDRIEPSQERLTACIEIGVCATAEEVCDNPRREVVGQVALSGCREMTGCQGTLPPEIAPANAGDNCELTTAAPARYIRIRAREGREAPVWSEVEVLGGPYGAAPINLAVEPAVEVEASNGTGDVLNDGDVNSRWTGENNRGAITIDLGGAQRVETVRLFIGNTADDRAAYEVSYGGDDGEYRVVHVFRGPFTANSWVEFTESGICGSNGQCEGLPRCEDYLYQDRGRVCDVNYELQNRVCEIFVAEDTGNNDRRKTCRSVCEASGLTCTSAGADIDNTCRSNSSQGCNESMKDFICRCLVP